MTNVRKPGSIDERWKGTGQNPVLSVWNLRRSGPGGRLTERYTKTVTSRGVL